MAEDDFADRSLPPTERHRREARARGQVARSSELTSAVMLLVSVSLMWFVMPAASRSLFRLVQSSISATPRKSLDIDGVYGLAVDMVWDAALILAPVILALLIFGIGVNLLQTGWLWTVDAVVPRFRGLRFMKVGWVENGFGAVLRILVLSGVTTQYLMTHQVAIRAAGLTDPAAMLMQPSRLIAELCLRICISLVILSLIDYAIRFWRNEQSLKMTVEERRREQLDDAVDPRFKRRTVSAVHRGVSTPVVEVAGIERSNP